MSTPITYFTARQLLHKITTICDGIMLRAGPFHKEGLYQSLLIHELTKKGFTTTRERVFNMVFKDSEGKNVYIGDNQSLRTDVELPELGGILELKSSGSSTKEENIWQLRNYLEQRKDCYWGIVINFISKFGTRTAPKIQCDLVYQVDMMTVNRETDAAKERGDYQNITSEVNSKCLAEMMNAENELTIRGVSISKVWTESIDSDSYPMRDDVFLTYVESFPNSDISPKDDKVDKSTIKVSTVKAKKGKKVKAKKKLNIVSSESDTSSSDEDPILTNEDTVAALAISNLRIEIPSN